MSLHATSSAWASLTSAHFTLSHLVAAAVVSGGITAWATARLCRTTAAAAPAAEPATKEVAALPVTEKAETKAAEVPAAATSSSSEWESGSSDDEDSDLEIVPLAPGAQPAIDARKYSDFKMVLVIRTDLAMTKGKVAAQCCHACLAAYTECVAINPAMADRWKRYGQAKITLKCNDENEMLELQAIARSLSLPAQSIRDAGRTQIAAGSRTVLAIGPGPVELVNQVTQHLKLY
ncbi:hypothetical protein H9P43_000387 [Blastocladiella emersonii ATCC 22665]|nr:hypothetical protein H9P43_000387 [Blastocladiella emersonii ATCC 22665]